MPKKEIKGIKEAAEIYNSYKYAAIYLDRRNGQVIGMYYAGPNEWDEFHSKAVINLLDWAAVNYDGDPIREDLQGTPAAIRAYAEAAMAEWVHYHDIAD